MKTKQAMSTWLSRKRNRWLALLLFAAVSYGMIKLCQELTKSPGSIAPVNETTAKPHPFHVVDKKSGMPLANIPYVITDCHETTIIEGNTDAKGNTTLVTDTPDCPDQLRYIGDREINHGW